MAAKPPPYTILSLKAVASLSRAPSFRPRALVSPWPPRELQGTGNGLVISGDRLGARCLSPPRDTRQGGADPPLAQQFSTYRTVCTPESPPTGLYPPKLPPAAFLTVSSQPQQKPFPPASTRPRRRHGQQKSGPAPSKCKRDQRRHTTPALSSCGCGASLPAGLEALSERRTTPPLATQAPVGPMETGTGIGTGAVRVSGVHFSNFPRKRGWKWDGGEGGQGRIFPKPCPTTLPLKAERHRMTQLLTILLVWKSPKYKF
mmetsp:Transcript_81427/g.136287  ORF Transcript_81427/g.136287 Transcript_81427/m.136287 type:complete len:259 (-) Transcript_81427:469-1245(-)